MAASHAPAAVRWTLWLERMGSLDGAVRTLDKPVRALFGTGWRGSLLRGDWLGHSAHPMLTDLAIGSWTSAGLLDLGGGRGASAAAQRLVGTGVLAAIPTAWTGWAEWSAAPPREKRVGVVHAASTGAAIAVYALSWTERRRGHHGAGVGLALTGAAIVGLGAYLGGHLNEGRKVASRHPAYRDS